MIVLATLVLLGVSLIFEAGVNLGASHLISGVHQITYLQSVATLFAARVLYVAATNNIGGNND